MNNQLPPFERLLQMYVVEKSAGCCKIGLAYRQELTNPHGQFHGGVIASLVDMATVQGLRTLGLSGPFPTVELSVRFKQPSSSAELFAQARPQQVKGKLFATTVQVIDKQGKLIAEAEVKSFVPQWKQKQLLLEGK